MPVLRQAVNDTRNNTYNVTTVGEPDAIPAKTGLVRVPYFNATWEVKPLENQQLAITYYLDVRPGGGIPAWVVNLSTTKGPYDTFSKLATLLKKSGIRYQVSGIRKKYLFQHEQNFKIDT